MNRLTRLLLLALAIIGAGCLTAGCAQGANIKKALSSLAPSGTVSTPALTSSPPVSSRPQLSPARTPASPAAPATVHHSVTVSVAPSAPAPGSHAAPSPSSSQATGGASALLWLGILLGVVIVIVAILVARHSRRRSALAGRWRSQAADACAKGSALYDAVSLAGLQETGDAADSDARWVDIQRRGDDLAQLLYRLRDSAPAEEDRARVVDVLASLQLVRSAMEAAHTPGGAGADQRGGMYYPLRSFETSLRALRSPDMYRY